MHDLSLGLWDCGTVAQRSPTNPSVLWKLEADPISPKLWIYTAKRGRVLSDCNSFQLTCSLRPGPVPPPCVVNCNPIEALAHGHARAERHPHAGRAAQLLMRRGAATNSATPLKGPMADVQTALTQARLVPPRAAPASPQLLSRSRIHSGASATRVSTGCLCELRTPARRRCDSC